MLALSIVTAHTDCARVPARASQISGSLELDAPIPRRFAPRLSVAADYAPCTPTGDTAALVLRSTCATPDTVPPRTVIEHARRASEQLAITPDVGALRAVALVDLEWSADSGIALDRSISYLRTASQLSDRPASSLADLSAAYILRAERTQNVRDLLEAIESASRSLAFDSSSLAAAYNRALALEQANLPHQAIHAWTRYLELDHASPWAREARGRLVHLRATERAFASSSTLPSIDPRVLTRTDPGRAVMVAWNDLFARWADRTLAGDSLAANQYLHTLAELGQLLEAEHCDRTVAEAVEEISDTKSGSESRRALAIAHKALARAQQLGSVAQYSQALDWSRRAAAESEPSGALHRRSVLTLGLMMMYSGQLDAAQQLIAHARAGVDSARDPDLAGRADWIRGTIDLRAGRYELAHQEYQNATRLLAYAGERENAGAAQSLAAEAAFSLGKYDEGFASTQRAARTLSSDPASLWRHNNFSVAAKFAAADSLPHAAVALGEESIEAADANGLAIYRTEARIATAGLYATIGDSNASHQALTAARSILMQTPPGPAHRWVKAELQLATAALAHPSGAVVATVDSAERAFSVAHARIWLVPTLLARARLQFRMGEVARGGASMDTATLVLDQERSSVTDVGLVSSFLESARATFDREIALKLTRGDTLGALNTLEHARSSIWREGPRLASVRSRSNLRPGRLIIDLTAIGDTVLMWSVSRNEVRLIAVHVSRRRVRSLVDSVRASLEMGSNASAGRPELATLYELLMRPALGADSTIRDITIVADGELGGIPFDALYDTVGQSYLVEHHTLRYALSLADATLDDPPVAIHKATAIADPAFDRRRFPTLPDLPGTRAEALQIAEALRQTTVLQGAQATVRGTVAELHRTSLFHYAGHAMFDDHHPELSALLLTPDPTAPSGTLTSSEIAHLRLRSHPLVVLSACETMRAGTGHSGDIDGLARAFLVAGARGVVGSQWRASDRTTRALMLEFYHHLRRSYDPARALQEAQIALIHSQDPALRSPSAWAAFRYAGE